MSLGPICSGPTTTALDLSDSISFLADVLGLESLVQYNLPTSARLSFSNNHFHLAQNLTWFLISSKNVSKLLWEATEAPVPHPSYLAHFPPALRHLHSLLWLHSALLSPSVPPWLSAHFAGSSGIPALCHLPSPTYSSRSSSDPTSGPGLQDG